MTETLLRLQALERRNINIKRFAEIPMADAEMVFPDKKIYLKPLLLIQLAIAVIGGLVAAFTALLSVRAHCFNLALLPRVQACGRHACPAGRLLGLQGMYVDPIAAFKALLSVRAHCHSVNQDQGFEGQACEAWRLVKL